MTVYRVEDKYNRVIKQVYNYNDAIAIMQAGKAQGKIYHYEKVQAKTYLGNNPFTNWKCNQQCN